MRQTMVLPSITLSASEGPAGPEIVEEMYRAVMAMGAITRWLEARGRKVVSEYTPFREIAH